MILRREFYAACKMQSIVRGFLDRILCSKKRKFKRAVELISRIMKGKLGRMKWRKEYWRSKSVVKSDRALKVLRENSNFIFIISFVESRS